MNGAPAYAFNLAVFSPLNASGTTASFFYGAISASYGLTSAPDFASLNGLFDLVKVVGVSVIYEPFGYANVPTTTGSPGSIITHVPAVMVMDAEASAATTFVALQNGRDYTDKKMNLVFNTSKPVRHYFPVKQSDVRPASTTATYSYWGEWMDAGAINAGTPVGGGLFVATSPLSGTANTFFGQLWVMYHTEWSFRL
jgi:hypothetical protein